MDTTLFDKLPSEKKKRIIDAGIKEFAQFPYTQANTDRITESCQISKGLLFHYFGSKLQFYGYCLDIALDRLTHNNTFSTEPVSDFYTYLFSSMDEKLKTCLLLPDETHFVNLASRESVPNVTDISQPLFMKYKSMRATYSLEALKTAIHLLPLKEPPSMRIYEAIQLYTSAIINKYLLLYQEHPDQFFADSPLIQKQIREYLDVMLYGVVQIQ